MLGYIKNKFFELLITDARTQLYEQSYNSAISVTSKFCAYDEINPQNCEAFRIQGLAYYYLNQHSLAILYLEKSATCENCRYDWYYLSKALAKAGRIDESIGAFKRIHLCLDHPNPLYSLPYPLMMYSFMSLLAKIGEYDKAVNYLLSIKSLYEIAHNNGTKLTKIGLPSLDIFIISIKPIVDKMSDSLRKRWYADIESIYAQEETIC